VWSLLGHVEISILIALLSTFEPEPCEQFHRCDVPPSQSLNL
jgi:hypothetical protein